MKWTTVLILVFLLKIEGLMLKCGEDIIIHKGEKKTFRFWSTDDELMKVEVLPERNENVGNAFLGIFKEFGSTAQLYPEKPFSGFDGGGSDGWPHDQKINSDSENSFAVHSLDEHMISRSDSIGTNESPQEQNDGNVLENADPERNTEPYETTTEGLTSEAAKITNIQKEEMRNQTLEISLDEDTYTERVFDNNIIRNDDETIKKPDLNSSEMSQSAVIQSIPDNDAYNEATTARPDVTNDDMDYLGLETSTLSPVQDDSRLEEEKSVLQPSTEMLENENSTESYDQIFNHDEDEEQFENITREIKKDHDQQHDAESSSVNIENDNLDNLELSTQYTISSTNQNTGSESEFVPTTTEYFPLSNEDNNNSSALHTTDNIFEEIQEKTENGDYLTSTEKSNTEDFANSYSYLQLNDELENQELKTIMTQLKTQEALLLRPLKENGNESPAYSEDDESDNTSLDIKLSILKNIIKGIASKISTDENVSETTKDEDFDQTTLAYETTQRYTEDQTETDNYSENIDEETLFNETDQRNEYHQSDTTLKTPEESTSSLVETTTDVAIDDLLKPLSHTDTLETPMAGKNYTDVSITTEDSENKNTEDSENKSIVTITESKTKETFFHQPEKSDASLVEQEENPQETIANIANSNSLEIQNSVTQNDDVNTGVIEAPSTNETNTNNSQSTLTTIQNKDHQENSDISQPDNRKSLNTFSTKEKETEQPIKEIVLPFNILNLFTKPSTNDHSETHQSIDKAWMTTDSSDIHDTTDDGSDITTEFESTSINPATEREEIMTVYLKNKNDDVSNDNQELNHGQKEGMLTENNGELKKTDHDITVINESPVFSKKTGSDNVLSLIRNKILNQESHRFEHKENVIILPFEFTSENRENMGSPYDSPKVLIERQDSQVVVITPQSNSVKYIKTTPIVPTTEDEAKPEIDITTVPSITSEIIKETTSNDITVSNNTTQSTDEIHLSTSAQSTIKEVEPETKPTQTLEDSKNTTADEYISFGIPNEMEKTDDELLKNNHNMIDDVNRSSMAEENGMLELLENFVLGQPTYLESVVEVDDPADSFTKFVENGDESSSQSNSYDTYITNVDGYPAVEENPSYDSNAQLTPDLLQMRKGSTVPDDVSTNQKVGVPQHRRDDSQYTNSEGAPFFIKLPGSPNAVPVYLQYEPVKVIYRDADKFTVKKQKTNVPTTSAFDNTIKNTIKSSLPDDMPASQATLDFHDRPDPFFLMDPPNLGDDTDDETIYTPTEQRKEETDSFSVELNENINLSQNGNLPADVVKGKPVYPGEYIIKNPDISYSLSDTNHLTNSVFSLGSKVTLPAHEPALPQYTPFPITTNPPKTTVSSSTTKSYDQEEVSTPSTTASKVEVILTAVPLRGVNTPSLMNSTENTIISELSEPSANDYKDSFGPYSYPELPVSEDTEKDMTEDDPNFFSLTYPDEGLLKDSEMRESPFDAPDTSRVPPKENGDFDIVALANFLHKNQKVWSNPRTTVSEDASWRGPSWDDTDDVDDKETTNTDSGASPWLSSKDETGESRVYSAFYAPEDIPGLDPAHFSYRSMPYERRESAFNDEVAGIERFFHSLPLPIQRAITDDSTIPETRKKRSVATGEHVYCEWNVKTDPGLYLLVTFQNLSAPYSVDCQGAYIEVERENNGYDARWCGNRAIMSGSRPHVIFAKTEVRVTVFDNGDLLQTHPTGFEADIEVIDLFDSRDYNTFIQKKATPKMRRLLQG